MGKMKTTPFSPARYEVEYMTNKVIEDTDVPAEDVHERIKLCRMSQREGAADLTAIQGEEYIEWLEDLGYDYNKLSVEARKARFAAKEEWGQ